MCFIPIQLSTFTFLYVLLTWDAINYFVKLYFVIVVFTVSLNIVKMIAIKVSSYKIVRLYYVIDLLVKFFNQYTNRYKF